MEISSSLYEYYIPSCIDFAQFEKNMILDDIQTSSGLFSLMIWVFIAILVIFSLFFWIPYVSSLNKGVKFNLKMIFYNIQLIKIFLKIIIFQINRSIEMLSILPVDIMKQSMSIKRFVLNLVKSVNKNSAGKVEN